MKADLEQVVEKLALTPNGLYVLLCIQKRNDPKLVDVTKEIQLLESDGFLMDGNLTEKAAAILAKVAYLSRTSKMKVSLKETDLVSIAQYRLLFPAGRLPSGSSSRSSVIELKPRFEWFFAKYPQYYDWNLVLQATAFYVDEYEERNYEFMRNSENFIYKQDVNKIMKSILADYCQLVLDGTSEQKGEAAPSIITIPGLVAKNIDR